MGRNGCPDLCVLSAQTRPIDPPGLTDQASTHNRPRRAAPWAWGPDRFDRKAAWDDGNGRGDDDTTPPPLAFLLLLASIDRSTGVID